MAQQHISTNWINSVTRRHITYVENRPALSPRFELPIYQPAKPPPIRPVIRIGKCNITLTVQSAK